MQVTGFFRRSTKGCTKSSGQKNSSESLDGGLNQIKATMAHSRKMNFRGFFKGKTCFFLNVYQNLILFGTVGPISTQYFSVNVRQ